MGASESTGRRRSRGGSTVGSFVEEIEHISTGGEDTAAIVIGVAAVVVAGLVLWGLSDSAGSSKKMMKAPGRDGHMIYRHVFERDPSSYFRDLRRK
ncbi:hypothetical protein Dimus_019603 [Dionaea muscipula]